MQVDFTRAPDQPADTHIFSNYALWFGVEYPGENGGEGIFRVTERLEWEGQRFSVLASDDDSILSGAAQTHVSHPDRAGIQKFQRLQEEEDNGAWYTLSRWNGATRGPIDSNYAFTDGSVQRYIGVHSDEWSRGSGMSHVPLGASANETGAFPGFYTHLPR